MVFLYIVLFGFVFVLDFLPLKKSAGKKDRIIFLIFLGLAFALAMIFVLCIDLPNPLNLISEFMKKIKLAYPEG